MYALSTESFFLRSVVEGQRKWARYDCWKQIEDISGFAIWWKFTPPHTRKTYALTQVFFPLFLSHFISFLNCLSLSRSPHILARIYRVHKKIISHLRWADEMKVNKSWNGSKKWKCAASIESVEVTEIRKEKGKSIKSVVKNKIPRFTATRQTRGENTRSHKLWWFNANDYFP